MTKSKLALLLGTVALPFAVLGMGGVAPAQQRGSSSVTADAAAPLKWVKPAIDHALRMPHDRDAERRRQDTPAVIGVLDSAENPAGRIATSQPGGRTITANNAFFQDLGSNGRTCFTCHQAADGWSFSVDGARARFEASEGTDPLFRLVDCATCPTADVSTLDARRRAYSLLLGRGTIRIGLPVPEPAEFRVTVLSDPTGCNTDRRTGLTTPSSGIVSVFRRPLPSTNLGFLSGIMWDGREPSLEHQAVDATRGHAQAAVDPSVDQQAQVVAFE